MGAWLLGLVALVASPTLATATLPASATSASAILDRATVDGLADTLAGDVDSAASPSSPPDPRFSLRPTQLGDYGRLLARGARIVEPLPRFDVELPRLPETRVRALALFDTPSRLPSNRVSDGNATGFGLCLVETCDGPIHTWLSEDPAGTVDSPSLYAFVGHQPNMTVDPLGLCRLGWDCFKENMQIAADTAKGAARTAGRMALGVADLATGGVVSGSYQGVQTFRQTDGTASEKFQAGMAAGSRRQLAVVTLGFSEAPDKVEHAKKLVGVTSVQRAGTTLGEAWAERDPEKAVEGVGQLLEGSGQIAGTALIVAAPAAKAGLIPMPGAAAVPAAAAPEAAAEAAAAEGTAAAEAAAPAARTAALRSGRTTRLGVTRRNASDWRATRDLWDEMGYGDILSESNRKIIAGGKRTPVVDDAWVKYFPEDEGLMGETIPMHHIQGTPLTTPLAASRHLDAHMPGGYRHNPGGPGSQAPIYPPKPKPPGS